MFIGRKEELKKLEAEHRLSGCSTSVILGRHRIGKTYLAKKFVKNKPHIYFLAERVPLEINLINFARKLARYTGKKITLQTGKNSFQFVTAFTEEVEKIFLTLSQQDTKTVIVFDEFRRMIGYPGSFDKKYSLFDSFLQRFLDLNADANIHFLFTGSSTSLMKKIFFDGSAPLYARIRNKIYLKGFSVEEIVDFLQQKEISVSRQSLVDLISTIDGIPYYLDLLSNHLKARDKDAVDTNEILSFFLNNITAFQDEPYLLFQEEENSEILLGILDTLKNKEMTENQLFSVYSGRMRKTEFRKYFAILERNGIITQIRILKTPQKTKRMYAVCDPFLRTFWRLHDLDIPTHLMESQSFNRQLVNKFTTEIGKNFEVLWHSVLREIADFLGLNFGKFTFHKGRDKTSAEFDAVFCKKDGTLKGIAEIKRYLNSRDLEKFHIKIKELLKKFQKNKQFCVMLIGNIEESHHAKKMLVELQKHGKVVKLSLPSSKETVKAFDALSEENTQEQFCNKSREPEL